MERHLDICEFIRTKLPDQDRLREIFVVSSLSDQRKEYTVAFDVKCKCWTCTCPHYIFRLKKSRGRCQHIAMLLEFIGE